MQWRGMPSTWGAVAGVGRDGRGTDSVTYSKNLKVVRATFSELPMARTDVVGVPVWACRTLSGGARPQIAGSYLPPDAPELAQASNVVVLTHLSDDRS